MRQIALCMLLAAATQAPAQDVQQRWEVPLAQCELEGAKLADAGIVPQDTYRARPDEPLRMEAEAAPADGDQRRSAPG